MTVNKDLRRMLRELKLDEAIGVLESKMGDSAFIELHIEDQLEIIFDHVISEKDSRRVLKYLRGAKFPIKEATQESMDYDGRKIAIKEIMKLFNNSYIEHNINVLISGATGSGKTFLASALGNNACRDKIRTRYIRMESILETVNMGEINHKKDTYIKQFGNYNLLIIDDWLLRKINSKEANILLEILEKRVGKSTIFVTQYANCDWMTNMTQSAISDAIASRVIGKCINIELDETNMRKRYGNKVLANYHSMN